MLQAAKHSYLELQEQYHTLCNAATTLEGKEELTTRYQPLMEVAFQRLEASLEAERNRAVKDAKAKAEIARAEAEAVRAQAKAAQAETEAAWAEAEAEQQIRFLKARADKAEQGVIGKLKPSAWVVIALVGALVVCGPLFAAVVTCHYECEEGDKDCPRRCWVKSILAWLCNLCYFLAGSILPLGVLVKLVNRIEGIGQGHEVSLT